MARLNWLFPKKRGVRRTGSSLIGRVGEASFFIALFLTGFAGLAFVCWSLVARSGPLAPHFDAVHYRQVVGVVEAKRVATFQNESGETRFVPQLRLRYDDGTQRRSSWTKVADTYEEHAAAEQEIAAWQVQQEVVGWIDPGRPDAVFLRPASTWGLWLTIAILVAVALAGGYGVIATALAVATSAERRAALEKATQRNVDVADYDLPPESEFPTVPCDPNLINSPGLKLKYRLPSSQQPAWQLFSSSILVLACGALAAALAVVAIEQHLAGNPRWFLTCFAALFVALAVWTVYYFLRELVSASWVGPAAMEISDMPLWPAESYRVHVTQTGAVNVRRFRVLLVCDEETVFLQGTDIRHDHQRVFEQELAVREGFEIDANRPLESYFSIAIPPDAMHSYKSKFNSINWKLVVELETDDCPDSRRVFPLIVYPRPSPPGD